MLKRVSGMRFFTLSLGVTALLASPAGMAATIEDYVAKKGEAGLLKSVKTNILKGNKRGEGPGPYWPAMGAFPGKVALISVYLVDEGLSDTSIFLPLPSWETKLSTEQANAIAGFYERLAVPVLKQEFANAGSELLTPEEFLQTDEQVEFYGNFAPKYGMVVSSGIKWLDKAMAATGNPSIASAPGYRTFPTNLIFNDKNGSNAMRELADQLGVDAVMGIAIKTRTTKKATTLIEVAVNLYGPNPVPVEERKGMKFLWYEGQPYGGATLQVKKVDLIQYRKKHVETKSSHDWQDDITTITSHYEQIATYASVSGLELMSQMIVRKLIGEINKRIGD